MFTSAINGGLWMEEAAIVAGLIFIQAVCAVYTVFISDFLAHGLEPLFLVAAGGFLSTFLLFPFAIAFERKKWPKKLGLLLAARLALIGLVGIPVHQVFVLLGVKKTTPAVATAMPNLSPGLIFIIASCLGIEKFDIRCNHTRYKILGTLMCLTGVMAMSLMQSPSVQPRLSLNIRGVVKEMMRSMVSNDWMIGCMYLLASVVALSCTMVLQAATMAEFQAPLSMCMMTSLMGSSITIAFQYITKGTIDTGASSIGITGTTISVSAAGLLSSLCASLGLLCVHKKGPVFVSLFQPMQTVCATILSALILKQFVSLGSLIGMALMFSGLYIVLWAKTKETTDVEKSTVPDIEKPLLG
ncbi:hypothetical protein HPP92_025160 [Vanilla planifolia]|uniref:WAT1-related protein n=1 Tax=Vanilla planifolia TaxID=51239 RepID=A0A835PKF9_VANPL|nr:hypothetical protein HPP92_025160 [Vanilla planifolia]